MLETTGVESEEKDCRSKIRTICCEVTAEAEEEGIVVGELALRFGALMIGGR
jgi:hypothetical protein